MADDTGTSPVSTSNPVSRLTAPPTVPAVSTAQAVAAGAPDAAGPARTGEIKPARRKRQSFFLPLIVIAALGSGAWKGYDWFVTGRFLVTTDDAHLFGDNEFKIRAIALKIAAKAVEQHLAQKKTDTKGPA